MLRYFVDLLKLASAVLHKTYTALMEVYISELPGMQRHCLAAYYPRQAQIPTKSEKSYKSENRAFRLTLFFRLFTYIPYLDF